MSKILIVEDDLSLSAMVRDWLTLQKDIVETVEDGQDALQMLKSFEYDMIILDLELPGMNGLSILKEFRSGGGTTPVLILTGKGAISDKEAGLDAGADDYLTKPFNARELSARIRALLRRPQIYLGDVMRIGDLVMDCAKHRVKRGDHEIKLLPREFDLLEFLMRNPDRIFSTETLLERVWSSESDVSDDAVKSCIKRLRKKIDVEGKPSIITSTYGVGYGLQSPSADG